MPQKQPSMTGCIAIEVKDIVICFYPKDMADEEGKRRKLKGSLSPKE